MTSKLSPFKAVKREIEKTESELFLARAEFDRCDANDPHGTIKAMIEIAALTKTLESLKTLLKGMNQ